VQHRVDCKCFQPDPTAGHGFVWFCYRTGVTKQKGQGMDPLFGRELLQKAVKRYGTGNFAGLSGVGAPIFTALPGLATTCPDGVSKAAHAICRLPLPKGKKRKAWREDLPRSGETLPGRFSQNDC
jgi:hypothetical protein